MIQDVIFESRKVIADDKGDVRHMLKCSDEVFKQFGEVYFSFIKPHCVKAWKKHLKQTQHFSVPVGNVKVVIYDDREHSSTYQQREDYMLGSDRHQILCIPPQVWYGFCSMDDKQALIVNCTDLPHDPDECVRKDCRDTSIPYQWDINK